MQPTSRRAALVGLVAAAVGLGVTELFATLDPAGPSPLFAAQDAFVDLFGSHLKNLAVALFGTADKAVLAVGAVAVVLGLGALLRRPAAFVVAAVLGAAAVLTRPDGSTLVAIVAPAAGAAAGIVIVRLGLGLAAAAPEPSRPAVQPMPTERKVGVAAAPVTRRAFHALILGGTALAVATGAGAVAIRRRATDTLAALDRALPLPRRRAVLPPVGPFAETPGLSPFVTPSEDFFRIDTALSVPLVDPARWTLTIGGRVDRELSFTYDDLLAMDLEEHAVTIACVSNEVGGRLVGNAVWTGVPLLPLLERAGIRSDAEQVFATSVDGFTAGFPVPVLRDGRTALLAVGMNGEPLPRDHGFPARLIVAGLYGYVSAVKWLERIDLTEWSGRDGYWMPRGWNKEGPVAVACRIDVPRRRGGLGGGTVPVAGVAWAPSIGVERVEVRIDDGPWRTATLSPMIEGDGSTDTWVQWYLDWSATPGEHTIEARAVDRAGTVQVGESRPPGPAHATGWDRRTVTVG